MMKSFTQFLKFFATCAGLFFVIGLGAQPLRFVIEAPASIAGSYELLGASFGPAQPKEIPSKPIKLAEPALACTAITNDLTGHIAFVDRGSCNFITKARFAQAKGAVAVIICNNANNPVAPGLPAGEVNDVTIQTALMLKPDCDKIKLELKNGPVNASLLFPPCNPVKQNIANAVYGNAVGEGDFSIDPESGDPKAWTIDNSPGKGWEWSKWGNCSKGAYAGEYYLGSNTACDGAMVFDSDFLDNGGVAGAFGTGSCPQPCVGSFTSPNINLSAFNPTGLVVEFTQAYRHFRSQYFLLASYDNGATYDTIRLNTEAVTNQTFTLNEKVRVGLCGADLSKKQIKLKFLIIGNYYFWAIDDVYIINEGSSDPQVNSNFYAVAPTFKTPASQAYTFPLLSDIRNNGPLGAENVVLTANVSKLEAGGSTTQVASKKNDYGFVDGCEQIENILFPEEYTMPSTPGVYKLDYVISTTSSNSNTTNDVRSANFIMTENSYSNCLNEIENGANYLSMMGSITNAQFIGQNNMAVGQYYYFPKGKGYRAKEFFFGVEDNNNTTQAFSSILSLEVYKIKQGTANNQDSLVDENERELIGRGFDPADKSSNEIFVSNETTPRRRLSFGIETLQGGPLNLDNNQGYLFLIRTSYITGPAYSTNSAVHIFPFLALNQDNFPSYNTDAVDYANHTIRKPNRERNYGGVINNNEKLVGNVTIEIYNELIIEQITNTENELAADELSIYPNPASSELNIETNFKNTARVVDIELVDVTGRIVIKQQRNNVKSDNFKINTSGFSSGVYLAKISTEEGTTVKKVMITNN